MLQQGFELRDLRFPRRLAMRARFRPLLTIGRRQAFVTSPLFQAVDAQRPGTSPPASCQQIVWKSAIRGASATTAGRMRGRVE